MKLKIQQPKVNYILWLLTAQWKLAMGCFLGIYILLQVC